MVKQLKDITTETWACRGLGRCSVSYGQGLGWSAHLCVAPSSQILSAMTRAIYRANSRKGSLAKEATQAELAELGSAPC